DGPELLVWATNRTSYGRLCRMLTLGKRRVEKGECQLSVEDFLEHSEGLIAAANISPPLVGGAGGGETSWRHPANARVLKHSDAPLPRPFPQGKGLYLLRDALGNRLSLALSRVYSGDDERYLRRMIDLSRRTRIPLLATNAVHYHDPNRRQLQDVLTCV